MDRFAGGAVADLMSAREAVSHNDGIASLADGGQQRKLRHGERHVDGVRAVAEGPPPCRSSCFRWPPPSDLARDAASFPPRPWRRTTSGGSDRGAERARAGRQAEERAAPLPVHRPKTLRTGRRAQRGASLSRLSPAPAPRHGMKKGSSARARPPAPRATRRDRAPQVPALLRALPHRQRRRKGRSVPTAQRPPAIAWCREMHAVAAGDEHLHRRSQVLPLEIAVEGVDEQHDLASIGRA